MANSEHVAILSGGVAEWNSWRERNPDVLPDLGEANLSKANLIDADFCGSNLIGASLIGANLSAAQLTKAYLSTADLSGANFTEADFTGADLFRATLVGANLSGAFLLRTNLLQANLLGAILSNANLLEADVRGADLSGADLSGACMRDCSVNGANLSKANLNQANLSGANLNRANLSGASLRGANLMSATLVLTNLEGADLTSSLVYGLSAWDVQLQGAIQRDLVITPVTTPEITVDNLEVAQFIYLLLNNKKVRHVIDSITSKVVLILGRFTPDRKAILDAIRDELRSRDYLPVLFDFEKPSGRDITETVSTLAHMARFVIADITDAKSIPQELMAIVPALPSVPVQPLLLASQREYGMFEHFKRFPWVLEPYLYEDQDRLLAALRDKVIGPAEKKAKEQRSI